MAHPARTITVAIDMSKAFDTINLHTRWKSATTNNPRRNHKVIANYINGRKAYKTYRTTHAYNVNLNLAFSKVASSHLHHLTFILQTYHHPEHWFRSCCMQITSLAHPHTHTQVRVQPRNTYNHTYIKFLLEQI